MSFDDGIIIARLMTSCKGMKSSKYWVGSWNRLFCGWNKGNIENVMAPLKLHVSRKANIFIHLIIYCSSWNKAVNLGCEINEVLECIVSGGGWGWCLQIFRLFFNSSYLIPPVDTRRRFNVYKTSIRRRDVV